MRQKSSTSSDYPAKAKGENDHSQFGPKKVLGTGWFGAHGGNSDPPVLFRHNTHFRITNPNCEKFIEITNMAIITSNELVYEGDLFWTTGGGDKYIIKSLSPHIILPINLSECLPKMDYRPKDADPMKPDQWMTWCCGSLPGALMYTLEISYILPDSQTLPPIGWQQSETVVISFDGSRSLIGRESQMITYE
ncbi:MAG: hypothetical protein JXB43_09915 [Dehalococcoidia bacterium]|nr:hypothetical protein [Dehalococcoidia bacterium]